MKRFKVLSLAALVAFAACDEGSEPIFEPTPTGTISGVVTIEGQARSGVTVTLSSGASTATDGSGAYSFAGVNAGAYTVSISGFPTDATFSSTARAVTITTAGQVVMVNFDGSYVRTAAIVGSVAAGGHNLIGVRVAISGANTAGANGLTDATGQYAFGGLRAGSYTVTISGWDAGQYSFASSSSTISLGAGEVKSVNFFGNPLATATITGTVTIEGAPAAGVKATLSSGVEATTNAAGAYTFPNLTAGSYTVTISGYPSDAVFESVAKSVTVPSAGSSVSANFAGTFVKTSTIVGKVSISGTGLAGVKVTLNTGASVNTDVNGDYAFAALRGGTYTVTISGWDATLHSFTTTSAGVTVATGESAIQNFAGAYVATAGISGILFLDEGVKNLIYDGPTVEKTYALSGVTITIEGGAVATYQTKTTADGVYSFGNLVPGTYRVSITPPANGTFGWAGGSTSTVVTLAPGGSVVVNWPFRVLRQYVKVYAFLGKDATVVNPVGVPSGVRPQQGITIDLYDTYDHAVGAVPAGLIGTAVTDATGGVTFNYLRSADNSPNDTPDNIVFAKYNPATTPASRTPNGEAVIEIKYPGSDTLVMAPDTFDLLNSQLIVRFVARDGMGSALTGWTYGAWDRSVGDTTTAGAGQVYSTPTAAAGLGRFVIDMGANTIGGAAAGLAGVDTVWVRINEAVGVNTGGLTYKQVFEPSTYAFAKGSFMGIVVNGTQPDSITLTGTQRVSYTQGRIVMRAHNEQDDVVRFTAGDPAPLAADSITYALYKVRADGNRGVLRAGPTTGVAEFTSVILGVDSTYLVVARSGATGTIISDTAYTVQLSGKQQADTAKGLNVSGATSALYSSFAWKYNNLQIQGQVTALNAAVPATGLKVWVKTAPTFVGPSRDTVVTVQAVGAAPCTGALVGATGAYCTNASLLEGPYTIEALDGDSASVWKFMTPLTTVTVLPSGTDITGAVNNASASQGSRDAQGANFVAVANFRATRMDTRIQGVIVNDRDGDTNDIDVGEALVGATVELISDTNANGTINAGEPVVATTTTAADGSYEFGPLAEGNYIVRASSASAHVTRALNGATGTHTNVTGMITTSAVAGAAAPAEGANNTRRVGTKTPAANLALPAWNYATDVNPPNIFNTHFTFLSAKVGQVSGVVNRGAAAPGVAQAGATVILTRCFGAGSAPKPPVAASLCTKIPGTQRQTSTSSTGAYTFTELDEGVYIVEVVPSSVGLTTIVAPAAPNSQYLATIRLGSSPVDSETVPAFLIN